MNTTFRWYLLLLLLAQGIWAFSQDTVKKKIRTLELEVDRLIEEENYPLAILKLDTLETINPNCAIQAFRLGFCNFKLRRYPDALRSFDRAQQLQQITPKACLAPIDLQYYHAKTLYFTDKPDLALTLFGQLEEQLLERNDKRFADKIAEDVELCHQYIEFTSTPLDIKIENLGERINSVYSDYAPLISYDQNTLIFTSKRSGGVGGKTDTKGEFFEDIYVSKWIDNQWQAPKSIGTNINTPDHDACVSLSVDGNELLIYRPDDKGSIYLSRLQDDTWSLPEKLGPSINTPHRETHAAFAPDGRSLYFTSDRPGGLGGLDIYQVYRQPDGTWGEARNLGAPVNTPFDEEGPFAHHDGLTLYFSSKGHESIGGYDIYMSQRENEQWSVPRNIGYSVNTSKDDVFFVLTADGTKAYFASQQDGAIGQSDLYQITYKLPHDQKYVFVRGKVEACNPRDYILVQIVVKNPETQQLVGVYKPNSRNGKFFIVLNPGKEYQIEFDYKADTFHSKIYKLQENCPLEVNYGPIRIDINSPCENNNAYIKPVAGRLLTRIYFDGSSYDTQRNADLDLLAQFLSIDPQAQLVLTSHTGARGNKGELFQLASVRAKSIVYYLVQKGVSVGQLQAKALGPGFPLVDDTEQSTHNDRVEIYLTQPNTASLQIAWPDPVRYGY